MLGRKQLMSRTPRVTVRPVGSISTVYQAVSALVQVNTVEVGSGLMAEVIFRGKTREAQHPFMAERCIQDM